MKKQTNYYKISKIMEYDLSDEEILILENDFDGNIDKFINTKYNEFDK